MQPSRDECVDIYRQMVLIRHFEELALSLRGCSLRPPPLGSPVVATCVHGRRSSPGQGRGLPGSTLVTIRAEAALRAHAAEQSPLPLGILWRHG